MKIYSPTSEDLLTSQISLAVRELRLWQALYALARQERCALLHGRAGRLLKISHDKHILLEQLEKMEQDRLRLLNRYPLRSNDPFPARDSIRQAAAQETTPERLVLLACLQEGAYFLRQQVRHLTQGNCTLASLALERISALQSYLVYLAPFQSSPAFPTGIPHQLAKPGQPASPTDVHSALETISNLRHQQRACQAVLQLNQFLTQ
ncbi:MAG: flagellar export chaperone FlgN [Anaerolineales bacterium]|nr:flagellar export chaperone FlgN [Anaerolineales bacterium]